MLIYGQYFLSNSSGIKHKNAKEIKRKNLNIYISLLAASISILISHEERRRYFVPALVRDERGFGSFCIPKIIAHDIGVKGAFEGPCKRKVNLWENNAPETAEWISSHYSIANSHYYCILNIRKIPNRKIELVTETN
jgi:hypothetical protein